MKKILQTLFWSVLVITTTLGCAKDKSGNPNVACDSFGNCYDSRTGAGFNDYGYNGYGNGYGYQNGYAGGSLYGNLHNRNRLILTGQMEYVANSHAWRKIQEGLGVCSSKILFGAISNCMQNLPVVTVVIENYQFSGPQNTSQGSFAVGAGYGTTPGFNVVWRPINGNTGYDTQVITPVMKSARLRVEIDLGTAAVTASTIRVRLYYGPIVAAEGQLHRVNR